MAKNNEKITIAILGEKVRDLETEVQELRKDVKDILQNHLPHLREEMAVAKMKLGIIVGLGSAIALKIIDYLLK